MKRYKSGKCWDEMNYDRLGKVQLVHSQGLTLGNNFKKRPELTAPNVQNQFQQSFDIVDIHGKHVHSVKS